MVYPNHEQHGKPVWGGLPRPPPLTLMLILVDLDVGLIQQQNKRRRTRVSAHIGEDHLPFANSRNETISTPFAASKSRVA
jgi:hypothetical protein